MLTLLRKFIGLDIEPPPAPIRAPVPYVPPPAPTSQVKLPPLPLPIKQKQIEIHVNKRDISGAVRNDPLQNPFVRAMKRAPLKFEHNKILKIEFSPAARVALEEWENTGKMRAFRFKITYTYQ